MWPLKMNPTLWMHSTAQMSDNFYCSIFPPPCHSVGYCSLCSPTSPLHTSLSITFIYHIYQTKTTSLIFDSQHIKLEHAKLHSLYLSCSSVSESLRKRGKKKKKTHFSSGETVLELHCISAGSIHTLHISQDFQPTK